MKTLIFIAFVLLALPALALDEYAAFIERWEGRVNHVYTCPAGYKTIGVGHRVRSDEDFTYLNDFEISELLQKDVKIAYFDAREIFGQFYSYPKEVRLILVDLAFNLGRPRLSLFVKTIAAIEDRDWQRAAAELKDSRWYLQTGDRARHHVNLLLTL